MKSQWLTLNIEQRKILAANILFKYDAHTASNKSNNNNNYTTTTTTINKKTPINGTKRFKRNYLIRESSLVIIKITHTHAIMTSRQSDDLKVIKIKIVYLYTSVNRAKFLLKMTISQ